ncbi:MAG: TraB domain-containing protein [Candidatus Aenigmarchaeota archaeon]
MPKIILVPTSHIARESLYHVRKAIESEKPDCVAVELDINRYHYLKEQGEESATDMIRFLGLPTFLIYWILKKFQNYFGKKTGIFPGSEMMEAVGIARERGITIALIDQPIEITLLKIRKITLSEKLKLFRFLVMGVFGMAVPFGKKHEFDLNRVPPKEIIKQAMSYLRKELPGFYSVLVGERNKIMAKNLKELGKRFDKIVCVIGAGHEKGIKIILGKD